jgi:hypothetical protein
MVRHVREVEKDLVTLQKKRGIEEIDLQRVSKREPISFISMGP